MQRLLWLLVLIIAVAGVALVSGATFVRHENASAVARAEALAADLQQLRVGASDYKAAQSIVTKFGSVPYENYYGTRDCADGYFERCTYMIACDDTRIHKLLLRHPFLSHLGFRDWGGNALIYVESGTGERVFILADIQDLRWPVAWIRSGGRRDASQRPGCASTDIRFILGRTQ